MAEAAIKGSAMSRADYEAYYKAIGSPSGGSKGNYPSGGYKQDLYWGGSRPSAEYKKVNNEIKGGIAKAKANAASGSKVPGFEDFDFDALGPSECEKEGMGGKVGSSAGLGCWQFWANINNNNLAGIPKSYGDVANATGGFIRGGYYKSGDTWGIYEGPGEQGDGKPAELGSAVGHILAGNGESNIIKADGTFQRTSDRIRGNPEDGYTYTGYQYFSNGLGPFESREGESMTLDITPEELLNLPLMTVELTEGETDDGRDVAGTQLTDFTGGTWDETSMTPMFTNSKITHLDLGETDEETLTIENFIPDGFLAVTGESRTAVRNEDGTPVLNADGTPQMKGAGDQRAIVYQGGKMQDLSGHPEFAMTKEGDGWNYTWNGHEVPAGGIRLSDNISAKNNGWVVNHANEYAWSKGDSGWEYNTDLGWYYPEAMDESGRGWVWMSSSKPDGTEDVKGTTGSWGFFGGPSNQTDAGGTFPKGSGYYYFPGAVKEDGDGGWLYRSAGDPKGTTEDVDGVRTTVSAGSWKAQGTDGSWSTETDLSEAIATASYTPAPLETPGAPPLASAKASAAEAAKELAAVKAKYDHRFAGQPDAEVIKAEIKAAEDKVAAANAAVDAALAAEAAAGLPDGWLDANGDGFDDNTLLDKDGVAFEPENPDGWVDANGDGFDDNTLLDKDGVAFEPDSEPDGSDFNPTTFHYGANLEYQGYDAKDEALRQAKAFAEKVAWKEGVHDWDKRVLGEIWDKIAGDDGKIAGMKNPFNFLHGFFGGNDDAIRQELYDKAWNEIANYEARKQRASIIMGALVERGAPMIGGLDDPMSQIGHYISHPIIKASALDLEDADGNPSGVKKYGTDQLAVIGDDINNPDYKPDTSMYWMEDTDGDGIGDIERAWSPSSQLPWIYRKEESKLQGLLKGKLSERMAHWTDVPEMIKASQADVDAKLAVGVGDMIKNTEGLTNQEANRKAQVDRAYKMNLLNKDPSQSMYGKEMQSGLDFMYGDENKEGSYSNLNKQYQDARDYYSDRLTSLEDLNYVEKGRRQGAVLDAALDTEKIADARQRSFDRIGRAKLFGGSISTGDFADWKTDAPDFSLTNEDGTPVYGADANSADKAALGSFGGGGYSLFGQEHDASSFIGKELEKLNTQAKPKNNIHIAGSNIDPSTGKPYLK